MDPDDVEDLLRTDLSCGCCDKVLYTTDEVTLIQVVYPTKPNGKIVPLAISDDRGDFEYPPCFVHLDCWEELFEPMEVRAEGAVPVNVEGEIAHCLLCNSGIRPWETTGLIQHGELRISPRCPQGELTYSFDPCFKQGYLCISCLATFNADLFEMWDEVTHNGECLEGIHSRCWRRNPCTECSRAKRQEEGQAKGR